MPRVKLNDGDGHWIGSDGELITTVWTSDGWKDLPGVYETHSEFLPLQPTDDSLILTIVLKADEQRQFFRIKTTRFINVNSADFDEVEHE